MEQVTYNKHITVETPSEQPTGINVGGVSLGTGYPWYIELPIILVVMALVYGAKKSIDYWFEKRKAKRLNV